MRRLLVALAGVLAAVATLGSVSPAVASQPEYFVASTTSGALPQDQLSAALTTAAAAGRAVRLPAGRLVVQRTLWIPAHATLILDPKATIVGSIPGQSLVRVQSGSSITGGTIENRSTSDCFDVDVARGATGATIDGVTFRGARTNAVYVNAPDVRNLTVRNSRFVGTVYGVLVNPGALRGKALRVEGNEFLRTTADAIEINAAISARANRVRDVVVIRNVVRDMRGSGDGSGFGVGMAGVQGFRVAHNRFIGVRNEAVHLENGTRHGLVRANLVDGGGRTGRTAIAVYRGVDSVQIRANVVRDVRGGGIGVLWDQVGSSTRITITRNIVDHVSQDGVVVGGDLGTGPFLVQRNAVVRAGGNGIVTLGSHRRSVVADNLLRRVHGVAVASGFTGSGVRVRRDNGAMTGRTLAAVVGVTAAGVLRSVR
jgi:hypothetical protein